MNAPECARPRAQQTSTRRAHLKCSGTGVLADAAAPEDGRTPAVVSECAFPSPLLFSVLDAVGGLLWRHAKAGIIGLPECREVHTLQCRHPLAQGPGRKLPVLHHRTEPRRRRPCPNPGWNKLAKVANVSTRIPTAIEFVDIAGLVKGASRGEGLGNKFLSHIREVDAAHPGRALLRRPGHRPCHRQHRPGARHRDRHHRTHAGRPGNRPETAGEDRQRREARRQARIAGGAVAREIRRASQRRQARQYARPAAGTRRKAHRREVSSS